VNAFGFGDDAEIFKLAQFHKRLPFVKLSMILKLYH
jgi:hypothetical protein